MSSSDFASRRRTGLWAYFWAYLALLYLPLLVLAVFSFHDSDNMSLPWQGFSLRWYRTALESSELLAALRTSFLVGLATAAIATLVGAVAGVAIVRFRFPGRTFLTTLALIPLAIPYLGLAVALLLTFQAIGVRPSLSTVVVGHSIVAVPYVLLLVATRAAALPPSIEEAAVDLGATWWRVLRKVHLPVLKPALVVGAITSFQVSFDELYLSFFLTGFQPTLPVYFYSSLRRGQLVPPALALTTCVAILLVAVLVLTLVVSHRALRQQARPPVQEAA